MTKVDSDAQWISLWRKEDMDWSFRTHDCRQEKHKALLLLDHQYEGFLCSVIEIMVSAGMNKT